MRYRRECGDFRWKSPFLQRYPNRLPQKMEISGGISIFTPAFTPRSLPSSAIAMPPASKLPCTSSDASAPPAKRKYVKQPILQAPVVAHTDVEQACRQLLAQSAGRNDYCYGFMDTCSLCPPLAELAVHNYAHAQSIYSTCMAELGLPTYPTMQSLMKPCEGSAEAGSSSDLEALPPSTRG